MTRKLPVLVLFFLAVSLLFFACQTQREPAAATTPPAAAAATVVLPPHGDNFSGQVYGIARGFSAFIRVDLTLVDGRIVDVYISKAQGAETGGWYEVPFRDAPGVMIATNSAEVDTIAGATDTTRGIRYAARDALGQIPPR